MKVTAPTGVANLTTLEDVKLYTNRALDQIVGAINGGIDTENLKCFVGVVNFVAANTDQRVMHNLGVIPKGYIKIAGPSATLFDGVTPSTTTDIYLRSGAAGSLTLMVLG